MILSDLSIRRPVFATVLSLLLVVLGLIAYTRLTLRELPAIDPPIVSVEVEYPGASAANGAGTADRECPAQAADGLQRIIHARDFRQWWGRCGCISRCHAFTGNLGYRRAFCRYLLFTLSLGTAAKDEEKEHQSHTRKNANLDERAPPFGRVVWLTQAALDQLRQRLLIHRFRVESHHTRTAVGPDEAATLEIITATA
jgi:hypothetical protein